MDEGGSSDGTLRLCVATRAERHPDDLIRFVAGPGGEIVPDLARKLPGRGVWVGAERALVEQAIRAKAFQRSLKRPVKVADDLADSVEQLLLERVLALFSLANKAGLVLAGFSKVEAALEAGQVAALVHARDAARDGADKLDRKYRAISAANGQAAVVLCDLTIDQMSLAMGRPNVVHAALIPGGATERFMSEAGRLARYRSRFDASGHCETGTAPVSSDDDAPSEA